MTITAPIDEPFTVALCDCCNERPGTAMLIVCGIEAWVCDKCRGIEEDDENDRV